MKLNEIKMFSLMWNKKSPQILKLTKQTILHKMEPIYDPLTAVNNMSPSFCGIMHYHIGFEIEVKYAGKKNY